MTNTAQPLVLIVEDDDTIARLLHDVFSIQGFRPLVTRSAAEAAAALAAARPALMTLDLSMPHISGQTLLQVVRAQPDTRALPVIVITSQLPVDPMVYDLVAAVLEKPFELAELMEAVRAALGADPPTWIRQIG
jgi:DNA-binding response OmpR family regulator